MTGPGLERLRNLGIVAHIDAGKTTLTERILFATGVEHRVGRVDEGTTVMDWMAEERERGITITAAATTVFWRDHQLNLVDTPGHVDFTVEVERSMRVLDGAVLVLDAVAGVQAQTETVWRQMERHRVPAIAFVNKCDRPGADFLAAIQSVQDRLGARAVPVQYPVFREGVVVGTIDLIDRRALEYGEGREATPVALDPGVADEVEVLRSELIDVLAEDDEEVLACVLEEREPSALQLQAALRRRTISRSLIPVLCGAALRSVGVQPVLDAIVDWLPSPLDVPPVRGSDPRSPEAGGGAGGEEGELVRPPLEDGPVAALAFKIEAGDHGDLTFVRVYSGRITAGEGLYNPRVGRMERIARVLRLHADARESLPSAGPGEVVGLIGPKQTGTGDTLCTRDAPILLEPLVFPEPVLALVLEPRATADRDHLREALTRMAREDPSLHVAEDESSGQWTVEGMGELHLEIVQHRLTKEFRVNCAVGPPRVSYREAPGVAARGAGRVERQMAGKDVFGALEIMIEPDPAARAEGLSPTVVWDARVEVSDGLRGPIEEALLAAASSGPRFGYPLVGARLRVVGSESRPGLDAAAGFVQAAHVALREALEGAGVQLLEPLMQLEVLVPDEHSSSVIADLGTRHAEVEHVESRGSDRLVRGSVPLARMFGYSTAVRSLSQGRAGFSLVPAGYRVVPEQELEERGLTWS